MFFLWEIILTSILVIIGIIVFTLIFFFYSLNKVKEIGEKRDKRILDMEKDLSIENIKKTAKDIFPYNKIARFIFIKFFENHLNNRNKVSVEDKSKCFDIFKINDEEMKNLSKRDIKNIYKRLSKIYHPDKETGSHEKMTELNNCKENLLKLILN
jgi:preprotein translocase subunit Sec63